MKFGTLALALGAIVAPHVAAAADEPKALQLKPKIALAAEAPHRSAPFVAPMGEPEVELLPRYDERRDMSRSQCNSERALCYDPSSGHIVYNVARDYMPELPGLKRDNITVKRDRIVFHYSF